jgi:Fe-S oxidoreductase/nitrate reductase gamma subunit
MPLTREIFGNIPPSSKLLFYALSVVAVGVFAVGVYRRMRLWRLGRKVGGALRWKDTCSRFLREVLLQRGVLGRGMASLAHLLLFSGFVVLLVGTTLIAIEHVLAGLLGRAPHDPVFHHGVYYAVFEILMDTFGMAFLVGCVLFGKRRLRLPPSVAHHPTDWVVLALLFAIGVTGFFLEGLRIVVAQTPMPGLSFVGLAVARLVETLGITDGLASSVHLGCWWFHAILALGLIAALPYTRLLHAVAGSIHLATTAPRLGVLDPISIEEVEETGRVGVGKIEDFTRQQLLELDACVSCGRCEEMCPAFEAGKPLSPRNVVQDLKAHLEMVGPQMLQRSVAASQPDSADQAERPSLCGETVSHETLWSCTACSACVDVCPLGVRPLDFITDMRRFLVGEGELRGPPATSLQKTQRSGNPWGLPPQDRFQWADGLSVPTVESNPEFDVLYWVGCAAAYDRRIRKVAQSMVKILTVAKVNFAVLGPAERCTGESARRMGEEFVFQELAESNIETLSAHNVKKIVTHCPHCLNSFRNDYPQFGGNYSVVHHSEFLAQLHTEGRLPLKQDQAERAKQHVTYHDPCYLGRINGVTEAPRQLVQVSLPGDSLVEMPRNRSDASCCGAGGGRMWFDDTPDQRIGVGRVQEALSTGAKTVAVSCPFCLTMIRDGVAAQDQDAEVRDIAEILADALEPSST